MGWAITAAAEAQTILRESTAVGAFVLDVLDVPDALLLAEPVLAGESVGTVGVLTFAWAWKVTALRVEAAADVNVFGAIEQSASSSNAPVAKPMLFFACN
jgi:hypothetical protein